MPRQERVFTVLVASPSDVTDERVRLEEVIREFNISWSRELGLRLDLVQWETHAFPGAGADAQDVINRQLPDDYDLFIGILWCRYGTSTGRAGSGTVEEFDRAKARYDDDPSSVKLMVYFKDEAVAPSRLDLEQLGKVQAFRDLLGDEGVLYWPFTSVDDFADLIRIHLTRRAQAWRAQTSDSSSEPARPVALAVPNAPEEDDDLGILDLAEVFDERIAELTEIAERLGGATNDLGQRINERSEEIDGLPRDSQGNVNRNVAKRLMAKAATDLGQYTARVEAELPLFHAALGTGMDAFVRSVNLSLDLDPDDEDVEQALEGLDGLVNLRSILGETQESITVFRGSVAELPRMTSELNRAKREAVSAIDRLIGELEAGQTLLLESEAASRDLLTESRKGKGSGP